MKKVIVCILLIGVAGLSILAQTTRRPNRARTAPSINNDSPVQKRQGGKPALTDPNARSQASDAVVPPPPPSKKEEDEVITVDTNLVTTPVSVLDRNGRFIPGLKKKDFKIFENGIQQQITYFQSEEQPFTVVLMIDISPSTKYHIDDIHYAAVTFVNQLRPNDKVMVVAFDQRVRVLTEEPTNEKQKLYAAIYKSQFGSGTSLYDAVDAVTGLDLLQITGRKAVVLFTDGVDTTSRYSNFESTIAGVEEIDALFYPIRYDTQRRSDTNAAQALGLPPGFQLPPGVQIRLGQGRSEREYEKGRIYLESLAANSGGRMFEAETLTNLEASFAGVAEELRRQYSVGYYPIDTGTAGERRQVKIQVARPKVVVRAKTSYVVKQNRASAESGSGTGTRTLN